MVKSSPSNATGQGQSEVCADAVDTAFWHELSEAERLAIFERIGSRLPVGGVGKPEDIAEAYLYLMKTGFSTGVTGMGSTSALRVGIDTVWSVRRR